MARKGLFALTRVSAQPRLGCRFVGAMVGVERSRMSSPQLYTGFCDDDELVLDLRLTISNGIVTIHGMWPSSKKDFSRPKSECNKQIKYGGLREWHQNHIQKTLPRADELKWWSNGKQGHCINQFITHNIHKNKLLVLDYFPRTLKLVKPYIDPDSELNLIEVFKRCGFKDNDIVKASVFMDTVKQEIGYKIIPVLKSDEKKKKDKVRQDQTGPAKKEASEDQIGSHHAEGASPHYLDSGLMPYQSDRFPVGTKVQAVYSEDGEWYDATIEALTPNGYFVSYEGWGNKEEVDPDNVRPLQEGAVDILLEAEKEAGATKLALKRKIAQAATADTDIQPRTLPAKLHIEPDDPQDVDQIGSAKETTDQKKKKDEASEEHVHEVHKYALLFGVDDKQRDHVPKSSLQDTYIRIRFI